MRGILMWENLLDVLQSPPQPLVYTDTIQSIDHFSMEILLSNMVNTKPNSIYLSLN